MTPRTDQAPLRRQMPTRALKTLDIEIARAKAHVGLPATASVCSCHEAGRDGSGCIGISACQRRLKMEHITD
jgi:hypothetical protein